MTASRIHVHIDHLVVDDVDAVDRLGAPVGTRRLHAAIGEAVAARLRDDPIEAPAWRHHAVHRATVADAMPPSVERLAGQVASAIHEGLAP